MLKSERILSKTLEKIKTAILFIIENPSQDDFVMMNCHIINQEGNDNSIELSSYWREQRNIVDDHLSELASLNDQIEKIKIKEYLKGFRKGLKQGYKDGLLVDKSGL